MMLSNNAPLIDSFGRVHTSLRISVTDRCNIRCFYCMPNENVRFRPRHEILTFEEITRFVRVVSQMGVHRLRLTGGEPLVRAELPRLVKMLAALPGVDDLALTTNGILLEEQAADLKLAGLERVNISLDTLSEEVFQKISRREGLGRVLSGIAAAQRAGFAQIRLNAIAIHGLTEEEILPLARFARERGLELRFIEYMPLDAEQHWQSADVLDGQEIRRILEAEFGPLVPVGRPHASQPASDFKYSDGRGRIGL
ncbi:MAG TPA: GTP 3',8-cyclase MoaA, partial [Lacipirellulaceae bacterium]|nr:GTP 3',8-cyclase MoaA [Lacipirellulaceae bacterium]